MQIQHHRAMLSAFSLACFADLLIAVGAVHLRSTRSIGSEQFFAFDYSRHGLDWVSGACSSRDRQSPIDLPAQANPGNPFQYKYKPVDEPFDVMNNGHTLSADFAGMGYGGLTYNGAWHELMNINVHAVSEHAWAGVKKPLELHLVHKHYSSPALLIVAIAMESAKPPPLPALLQFNTSQPRMAPFATNYVEPPPGDADFNPTLQMFLKEQPPPVNMKASVPRDINAPLDFSSLLSGGSFYEYAGSLTAPPCAEIATWLVRKDTLKASDKQVLYLHDMIYKTTADFGNYRALMPPAGRSIKLRQAIVEDLPAQTPGVPHMDSFGSPQQSDREFRAMKWAMDAMTIAKASSDYIKDLDMRMRNAASAHAEALAPALEPLSPSGDPLLPGVTTPFPNADPVEMEATAKAMAKTLAETAREAIEDATARISKEAKAAALKSAMEAANIVQTGQGSNNELAVDTGLMPPTAQPPGVSSMMPGGREPPRAPR